MYSNLWRSLVHGIKTGDINDEREELTGCRIMSFGYTLVTSILMIDLLLFRGNLFHNFGGTFGISFQSIKVLVVLAVIGFYTGFQLCSKGIISGRQRALSLISAIIWPAIAIDYTFKWLGQIYKTDVVELVGNVLWLSSLFLGYYVLNRAYKRFLSNYERITEERTDNMTE
jgi:hypothetical protein